MGGPGLSLHGESVLSRKEWSELGGHLLWAVPATAHRGDRKAWSLEPSGAPLTATCGPELPLGRPKLGQMRMEVWDSPCSVSLPERRPQETSVSEDP